MKLLLLGLVGVATTTAIVEVTGVASTTAPARRSPFDDGMIGVSIPSRAAAVAPEPAGTIATMPLLPGQAVRAGDILCTLSARLQELEVERLAALVASDIDARRAGIGLDHMTARQQRQRELAAAAVGSEAALAEAELEQELATIAVQTAALQRELASNELAQAQERLAQRTLRAPFDGVIARRWRQSGEAVESWQPVVEVVALDPLWIEFECPLAQLPACGLGATVHARPTESKDVARPATVVFVAPVATTATGTVTVRAALANPGASWRAGLKMMVRCSDGGGEAAAPTPPGGGR